MPVAGTNIPLATEHLVGSLLLEADFGRARPTEHTLLTLQMSDPMRSHMSFHLSVDGALTFARRIGSDHRQVTMKTGTSGLEGPVRITCHWDVPANRGLLTMEAISDGVMVQKPFASPLPILAGEARALSRAEGGVTVSSAIRSISLSDCREPVGLAPCLGPNAPVLTPGGYRPVQELRAGDKITNYAGETQRIAWIGSVDAPAGGQFQPVRLNTPYFGLITDILVGPEARVMVSGPEVEYLFGDESVLVEARALLQTGFAKRERAGLTMRYYQILLEDHDILDVAGAPVESLFIGNLAAMPDVLATTILEDQPAALLPKHKRLAFRALRDYEAFTLRAALLSR
ncbi:Hint domain-containing protein [Actibacterium mucosum]|nr:Hint domain-containing protein [Actibacterium mucosum]